MARSDLLRVLYTISLAISLPLLASAQLLTSNGISVALNGSSLFISPYSVGNVSVDPQSCSSLASVYGFYPVTVVQQEVGVSSLPAVIQNFTAVDDVFQLAFLQAVFLPNAGSTTTATLEGVSSTILALESSAIPSGPYFMEASTGNLFQAYALYSDFAGAFTEPLLQTPTGSFVYLSAQIAGSDSLTIGVPSRLYYTPTAEKPLAGVRFAIKDIFDLAGVKTSNGNRAWYSLYPAASTTGPAVQRLIDAGAIIVGKQKPSQFANGEEATADWVSYLSPFNPRGDGYQDPSSSSSGAGASIGSYEWLDIAVGSDTGGSIRGPSEVQGLFGNRPSHGLVPLTDVMPLSPVLDTAGFLTRSPAIWFAAQSVMYSSNFTNPIPATYPPKILTYNYPTNASASGSAAVLVPFLQKLTTFLSANVTAVNLTALWAANHPSTASSSLSVFLNLTYPILIAQQQVALVKDPFFADYAAVHDGRTPFVDPVPLARWAFGESFPPSALTDAIANKTAFMDFFNTEVLPPSTNPAECTSAFFIYVGSTGGDEPNERNQYFDSPTAPYGFSSGRISVFTEVPDSVFPIGQSSFFSNITNHTEYLPVTVDILAAKGCDAILPLLAADLVKAGIIQQPVVGQSDTTGGEILMRRTAVLNEGMQERRRTLMST